MATPAGSSICMVEDLKCDPENATMDGVVFAEHFANPQISRSRDRQKILFVTNMNISSRIL